MGVPGSGAQYVRCTQTTHSGPHGGLRGPLRCLGLLLEQLGTLRLGRYWTRYYPPGVPTRYTPPWYPPDSHDMHTAADRDQYGTTETCTYDRFDIVLGEPRGAEYSRVSGSQAGLMRYCRFTRPFDWVLH